MMAKKTVKKKRNAADLTTRNNNARKKDIAELKATLLELQLRIAHLEELSGTW